MVDRKVKKKLELGRSKPVKRFSLFIDKLKLSLQAFWMLLKKPAYLISFIVLLFIFTYFLTFFKDGSSRFAMIMSSLSFDRKLEVLGAVIQDIPLNFTSLYGVTILLLSLLQAISITLLIFAWKKREKNSALDSVSTGGIGALLGFLALGCPSCGVTFVTPILTAIAGTGAAVMTESVSRVFMILALVLIIYTIAQLGYVDFVIMSAEKYEEKHAKV